MWRVPKIWEDGRCFIIGGGTSMPRQFGVPEDIIQDVYTGKKGVEAYSPYMSAIHSEHCIGVNMAYRIGTWVDMVIWGDDGFWRREKSNLLQFSGLRVTCQNKLEVDYHSVVKVLRRDPRKHLGLSFKDDVVCWNKNSGAAAINLAVLLGAKQIILLGFDMKLDADKNQHWHKYYASNVRTVAATFKMHLKGFPVIAEEAKKAGIEILNCNLDSGIDSFRKIELKDIICR